MQETQRAERYRLNLELKKTNQKMCSRCGLIKSLDDFSNRTPKLRYVYCRACVNKAMAEIEDSGLTVNRVRSLKYKYGLTVEQYQALEKSQDYRCAICRTVQHPDRGWNVDHDHSCCNSEKSCGQCVRGLLCTPCNQGLGSFRDNAANLSAAVVYLTNGADRYLLPEVGWL